MNDFFPRCSRVSRPYLYGAVSLADHLQLDPLSSFIQGYAAVLYRDDSTRLFLRVILRRFRERESLFLWDRQETSIERLLEVSIIGSYRVVNRNEICSRRKSTFDLELRQGGNNGWQDVPSTKHGLANRHEVRDCVVAIAHELRGVLAV